MRVPLANVSAGDGKCEFGVPAGETGCEGDAFAHRTLRSAARFLAGAFAFTGREESRRITYLYVRRFTDTVVRNLRTNYVHALLRRGAKASHAKTQNCRGLRNKMLRAFCAAVGDGNEQSVARATGLFSN